jgi:ATP-dependent DNA helicase RecG
LQRTTLENKGENPDVLYLSATPIPRTYALTLYGDTDISIIRTKPKGRKEIITKVYSESNLKAVLTSILNEIKSGHQAFVVSPLIENEESDLNSVVKLKEKFNDAFNNQARIEIIHGQMKQEVKDSIMNDFINNKIQILISTTVIEVGIDVPNATIMTIFNAERFGLATLHQLRGRVGRGSTQAYCFLISNKDNARLKVMEESNDGFYITEKDFEQRREGDLFGTRQSGDMSFKLGDVKKDYRILLQAKKDCEDFIKGKYYLENPLYTNIIANLQKHN